MRNVESPSALPEKMSRTAGPSPKMMTNGRSNRALNRLEYQLMDNALPPTASNPRFIAEAWRAVIKELAMPKQMPRPETWTPSRKTPMTKPEVTSEHDKMMR